MSQNWSSDKSTPTINAIASATGKKMAIYTPRMLDYATRLTNTIASTIEFLHSINM